MEVSKKVRGKNFTESEKKILFDIATSKFKSIIDNKRTDAVTVAKKRLAWNEITQLFNYQAQTGERTPKQLHALYDNLKKTARINSDSDKKNAYKTEGDNFIHESTPIDTNIVNTVDPLANEYDCCATYINSKPNCSPTYDLHETFDIKELPVDIETPALDETANTQITIEDSRPVTPAIHSGRSSIIYTSEVNEKRKRKHAEVNVSRKKRQCINTVTNRFIQRKNFKDKRDDELQAKRLEILNIEKEIKQKQLEAVKQQLENERKMFEINLKARLEEIEFEKKICQLKLKKLE